jgi:hypothetical protein
LGFTRAVLPDGAREVGPDVGVSLTPIGNLATLVGDITATVGGFRGSHARYGRQDG